MQTHNLIGKSWITADSSQTIEVTNPATNETIASVPLCGRAETRRAIEAAAEALPAWKSLPAMERARPLRRMADLMLARQDELAKIMTAEQGKPLAEARGEIAYAASFIEWAAEEGKRLYGETIPASASSKRILVLRQPVGVVAAITPWNFPSAMITRKLGPALACGCTFVCKPAEQTPLSAIALGEIALEAGIPPGAFNIITGDAAQIGEELFANPTVRKISFTGSTEVGKILIRQSAENVTRLSLELGGHAPFIVFDDADLDAAVAGAIATKFRNAGQTCICANRFLIQAGIYDKFRDRFAAAMADLTVGIGTDDSVTIGPLIDDAAIEKVQAHVTDAVSKGATVCHGGKLASLGNGHANRFFEPTLLDGVTGDMLISSEETFGPVAPLRKFKTEAEAVAIANDTPFGLAAYFYTQDASRLIRFAEALEYGIIGANDAAPSTAQAPFGGVKHSGYGREGGHHVMHEYTSVKYISWGIETS